MADSRRNHRLDLFLGDPKGARKEVHHFYLSRNAYIVCCKYEGKDKLGFLPSKSAHKDYTKKVLGKSSLKVPGC